MSNCVQCEQYDPWRKMNKLKLKFQEALMEIWGRWKFKGAKITETLSSPGGPTDDESESTGTLAFYAYVLSPLVTSEQLK